MFKISKLKIALAACILSLVVTFASAAELSLKSDDEEIGIGSQFIANLFLSTRENINAIEGKIIFPRDLLELKEIRDGNSIVNFWVERPFADDEGIYFSGITPGGYSGENGLIFFAIFQAKKEGKGIVELKNIRMLLNDGAGTPSDAEIYNLQFTISNQLVGWRAGESVFLVSDIGEKDAESPEDFTPQIASDKNIFDGKYFLVFATQDKGASVDYYAVREGWFGGFNKAESPYILENQALAKTIFVKAVDKSGNEKMAKISAPNPAPWYKNYFIIVIIILAALIIASGRVQVFRKISHKILRLLIKYK